jgi:hypothetical protein
MKAQEFLQEWEKKNNPFYPEEMKWDRLKVNLFSKDFDYENNRLEKLVMRKPTEIKDRNGNMIYFGDKVRFADKVEWYRGEYWADVMVGNKTKEQALKEINERPYEERTVESVQDYEWLLSSEIQTYWELSA